MRRYEEHMLRHGREGQGLVRKRPEDDQVREGTPQPKGSRATAGILQMNSTYFYLEQMQQHVEVCACW